MTAPRLGTHVLLHVAARRTRHHFAVVFERVVQVPVGGFVSPISGPAGIEKEEVGGMSGGACFQQIDVFVAALLARDELRRAAGDRDVMARAVGDWDRHLDLVWSMGRSPIISFDRAIVKTHGRSRISRNDRSVSCGSSRLWLSSPRSSSALRACAAKRT